MKKFVKTRWSRSRTINNFQCYN